MSASAAHNSKPIQANAAQDQSTQVCQHELAALSLSQSAEQFHQQVQKISERGAYPSFQLTSAFSSVTSLPRPETPQPTQRTAYASYSRLLSGEMNSTSNLAVQSSASAESFLDDPFGIRRDLSSPENLHFAQRLHTGPSPLHPFYLPTEAVASQTASASSQAVTSPLALTQQQSLMRSLRQAKQLAGHAKALIDQLRRHMPHTVSHDRHALDNNMLGLHVSNQLLRETLNQLDAQSLRVLKDQCMNLLALLEHQLQDNTRFSSWSYDAPNQVCIRAISLADLAQESRSNRLFYLDPANPHHASPAVPQDIKNYLRYGNHESLQFSLVDGVRKALGHLTSVVGRCA